MANFIYDKARQSFLGGNPVIDWDTDDIKAVLVRGYTPNAATHQFLSDVTGAGGTLVATSGNLGTKTITAGVADAADIAFTAVGAGAACQHVILYKDTTVAGTSPLIACFDTMTGLPVTPNGGDINVAWGNVAGTMIFKL